MADWRNRMSGTLQFLLGAYLIALVVGLLYAIFVFYPSNIEGGPVPAGVVNESAWVNVSTMPLGAESQLRYGNLLVLLAILAGTLGAALHVATSFYRHAGARKLEESYASMYVMLPVTGGALGLILYATLRAGLLLLAEGGAPNVATTIAIGGLGGLFARSTTRKLRQAFDKMFSVPPEPNERVVPIEDVRVIRLSDKPEQLKVVVRARQAPKEATVVALVDGKEKELATKREDDDLVVTVDRTATVEPLWIRVVGKGEEARASDRIAVRVVDDGPP